MATTLEPLAGQAPRDEKVYHPLDRLRGIIRRYIVVEGILSILLFFLAWFTIALALDYGIFKAFTWDWVQDGAWGLRVAALIVALGLLGGIFAFRIVQRLTIEFSYPALALVLERRFPQLLGDRLITAVELADVEDAAKYGYSKEMIRATIVEARSRVGQVDVNAAFNWRRLRLMGLLTIGWAIGLVVFGFAGHAVAAAAFKPRDAAWKSYHVASVVVERDLFLMNTPWPRRALLELQGIDEKGIRTPRDTGKASVRVKAYRWVIADRSKFDGWRPLRWSEVTSSFVGMPVPDLAVTAAVNGAALVPGDATVDDVVENSALLATIKSTLGAEKHAELDGVIRKLDEMATDPANGRWFRKLDHPAEVTYKYKGVKSGGDGALKSEGNGLFAGDITGLKEDVLFRVRAADFRTPQRPIVLVPPPALIYLKKTEFQPAYRHYASPLIKNQNNPDGADVPGGYSLLAGLRQRMHEENLTLTGQLSHFSVPIGTEVVITGVTEKPIVKAFAIPQGRSHIPGGKVEIKDGQVLYSSDPIELPVGKFEEQDGDATVERGTFTIAFRGEDRIKSKESVQFDLEFVNEDGLRSRRQIQINVLDDNPPLAEVLPDVIRRVNKHFWVTARATIPFNTESRVKDEIGLSKVAYIASYKPSDAEAVQSVRAAMFARKTIVPATERHLGTVATSLLEYLYQVRSDQVNSRREASFAVPVFRDRDRDLEREKIDVIMTSLSQVKQPLSAGATNNKKATSVTEVPFKHEARMGFRDDNGEFQRYRWQVTGDFFPISVIEIEPGKRLAAIGDDVQTRYEMQLYVEATDTNFDTGPRVTRSEPIDLLIVSESDLLVEIGKDEIKLAAKLDDALRKLGIAKTKYEFVRLKSESHLPDEIDAVRVRSKDSMQDIAKARELVDGVNREFRKIELECVYNQLAPANIAQYGRFANRGERIMGESPRLVSEEEERDANTERSETSPMGRLTPKSTFPRTEKRLGDVQSLLDLNQWPSPPEVEIAQRELSDLEEEVRKYRRAIGEAQDKERLKNQLRMITERQDAIARAIGAAYRKYLEDQTAVTPRLAPVGQTLLAKGETKKIRQGIEWRQYRKDDLIVKLVSSDPAAVIVPAEIKLNYDDNSLDFSYEIRAAAKEGDYTITLSPSSGDPVVIQVQVK